MPAITPFGNEVNLTPTMRSGQEAQSLQKQPSKVKQTSFEEIVRHLNRRLTKDNIKESEEQLG